MENLAYLLTDKDKSFLPLSEQTFLTEKGKAILRAARQNENVKFKESENLEIKSFSKKLQVENGFAVFSESYNREMLKQFPNSQNERIQTIRKHKEIFSKK